MTDITIGLKDPLNLIIKTDDMAAFKAIKEAFTRKVKGYLFMPKYKSGFWDGRTCMVRADGSLPFGLLPDLVRICKGLNYGRLSIKIEDSVKELFRGPEVLPEYNLSLYPYPYQKECIEACLSSTRGIIRVATAGGKSNVIAYILKTLHENKLVKKSIVIVPTVSLIEQFLGDCSDYGFSVKGGFGKVWSQDKDWSKEIVFSTWQTLAKNHDKLKDFECIIIDECHLSVGHELKKILSKSPAKYRFGFTGTLHDTELENWNTKSYLGPVLKDFPAGLLAKEGYISKCNVIMFSIDYINDIEGDYNYVKDAIFNNNYRLNLLKEIIRSVSHNILLLVGKKALEGKILEDFLKGTFPERDMVFLSGDDKVDLRETWRKKCIETTNNIVIATFGIFQLGINIPNLKYLVLASPFKSKVRVLQSVGRSLRKHVEKFDGAFVFDIVDNVKYLDKFGRTREKYYAMENFDVKVVNLREGEKIDLKGIL